VSPPPFFACPPVCVHLKYMGRRNVGLDFRGLSYRCSLSLPRLTGSHSLRSWAVVIQFLSFVPIIMTCIRDASTFHVVFLENTGLPNIGKYIYISIMVCRSNLVSTDLVKVVILSIDFLSAIPRPRTGPDFTRHVSPWHERYWFASLPPLLN